MKIEIVGMNEMIAAINRLASAVAKEDIRISLMPPVDPKAETEPTVTYNDDVHEWAMEHMPNYRKAHELGLQSLREMRDAAPQTGNLKSPHV